MTVYIIRRLLQTVVMLVILSIVFFLLLRYQPQSSCYSSLGCSELLALDQPISTQYVVYIEHIVHLNFGLSTTGVPVSQEIAQRLPATIILVAVALTLQQLIALPLGMLAAIKQYSRYDQALTALSYLFLSIPAFLLADVLILVVGQYLGWLPWRGSTDLALPTIGSSDWWTMLGQQPAMILGDLLRHLILPAFVLMATGIAIDSRFMRSAMLQVLHQDYIRTARAKGSPRRLIIFKHAFRNALLPIITNLGLYLPVFIGGVVVVEEAFTFDGVGTLFITPYDFPTLQAMLLLSSVAVLLANLLADIAYAVVDPRIRYDAGSEEAA